MAKRKNKTPKYTLGSLLLLLAFAFYVEVLRNTDDKPVSDPIPKENPAKATKKHKPVRHLTVFEGKITGIKDGDTFEVLYDSIPERVRLAEIDCPEKSQPFGKNARQYASDLCFGKIVTVTSNGKRDRYGRVVGTVTTADGVNVNESLITAGLAWHYTQYSKDANLTMLQEEAMTAKRGLWIDKSPIAPWDWRKQRREKNKKDAVK